MVLRRSTKTAENTNLFTFQLEYTHTASFFFLLESTRCALVLRTEQLTRLLYGSKCAHRVWGTAGLLPSGRICARPTNPVLCVLKHTNPHLSALLHVWAYWNEHNRKHVAAMWYSPFAETYRKVTVDLSILFPACCWTLSQSCRIQALVSWLRVFK